MKKYDETQIKKHPKRNKEQNKMLKDLIYQFDLMFGEYNTPLFLCMILDGLDRMMKKATPSQYLKLRTIEIKFNDFYSIKLNCETLEYID